MLGNDLIGPLFTINVAHVINGEPDFAPLLTDSSIFDLPDVIIMTRAGRTHYFIRRIIRAIFFLECFIDRILGREQAIQ